MSISIVIFKSTNKDLTRKYVYILRKISERSHQMKFNTKVELAKLSCKLKVARAPVISAQLPGKLNLFFLFNGLENI